MVFRFQPFLTRHSVFFLKPGLLEAGRDPWSQAESRRSLERKPKSLASKKDGRSEKETKNTTEMMRQEKGKKRFATWHRPGPSLATRAGAGAQLSEREEELHRSSLEQTKLSSSSRIIPG